MGLGDMVNKAKDAVAGNADNVKDQGGQQIDKHLDGDKADKAKDALNKGVDSLGGDKGEDK